MCQYRPYLLGVHADQKAEPEVEVLLHGKEHGPDRSVEKCAGVYLRREVNLVGASRSYGVGRFVDEPEQPGTIGLRHLYSVGIVVPMAGKNIFDKVESERQGKENDASFICNLVDDICFGHNSSICYDFLLLYLFEMQIYEFFG